MKHYLQTLYIIAFFLITISCICKAQSYNYYFGNIHAHSSYSDGNKDSASSLMTTPLQDFNYAKASQHIDFYGISDHNHLAAGMQSPVYYHKGLADADSATTEGSFVALYGMEWGIISGGGHVIIYGYDSLIGWETNNYDVYVAKNNYTNLWKKINAKQGAFGYLAHPEVGDFGDILANPAVLQADNAIAGMAVRSGPAFSTNTTYSNPSTSNNIADYNNALKQGYHVGVGLDHDTHYSVFGRQSAGRLVVLAPALTRAAILEAFRKMRFYSSDDWNTEVNFTISNQSMGSILEKAGSPTINVTVTDPDISETVSTITVYYGIPGSGNNPTTLNSVSNSASLSYTHTINNNSTYYYYLKITQGDGNTIWTSPIWYTRNDAVTNSPPVANFTSSSTSLCSGHEVTFTDNTTNAPTDWYWSIPGAIPDTSSNQSTVAVFPYPGTYLVSLTTSNLYGTSNTVTKTITVLDCNTSIAEGSATGQIHIYPNPANNVLIVDAGTLPGSKTIEISDLQGKLLLAKTSTAQRAEFDIAALPAGTYIVNVKLDEILYSTEKIVVERK